MMLYRPECIALDVKKNLLSPEMFFSELNRRLYTFITQKQAEGGFDFGLLSESFSQEEISKAVEMVSRRRALSNNSEDTFVTFAEELKKESERIRSKSENEDITAVIQRLRNDNK